MCVRGAKSGLASIDSNNINTASIADKYLFSRQKIREVVHYSTPIHLLALLASPCKLPPSGGIPIDHAIEEAHLVLLPQSCERRKGIVEDDLQKKISRGRFAKGGSA